MAKIITLEEYNKQYKKNNSKKRKKIISKSLIVEIILGLVIIILSTLLVYLKLNTVPKWKYKELKNDKDNIQYAYDINNNLLGDLTNGYGTVYIKEKLDFFDKNIVFQIEGFGNYYYSYDCMMKKVNGAYSFWTYNVPSAKARGLAPGNC